MKCPTCKKERAAWPCPSCRAKVARAGVKNCRRDVDYKELSRKGVAIRRRLRQTRGTMVLEAVLAEVGGAALGAALRRAGYLGAGGGRVSVPGLLWAAKLGKEGILRELVKGQ